MRNFVQPGHEMPFVAGAAITSGDLVVVGDIVGVAAKSYANGEAGILEIDGVFKLLKNTSQAFTQGAKLYKTAASQLVTTTSAGNNFIGYAWTAQDAADVYCQVVLARPGS